MAVSKQLTSVVIVNYNAGEHLTTCVLAVLASTVAVEIFVIDNASSDDSLSNLQTAVNSANLYIVQNKQNRGFAAANNQVLDNIAGDYVLFLNPDCFIQADTIQHCRNIMDANPSVGMAGVMVCNLDGSEQAGARRSVPSPWRAVIRVLHLNRLFPHHPKFKSFVLTQEPAPQQPIVLEGISGAFMFVRREALAEVGGLDEGYFLHCEDLDWFMRFRARNWQILFIPQLKVTHLKGACSGKKPLSILWYKHKGMIRFYRKFFAPRYPSIIILAVIMAVWFRFGLLSLLTILKREKGT
jgi:GT2 family glycosyltransferase